MNYENINSIPHLPKQIIAYFNGHERFLDFKAQKEEFKKNIIMFMEAGGSLEDLKGKIAISINAKSDPKSPKDRIESLVTNIFKEHQRKCDQGHSESLIRSIIRASEALAESYKIIESLNFGTERNSIFYQDYKDAKTAIKQSGS